MAFEPAQDRDYEIPGNWARFGGIFVGLTLVSGLAYAGAEVLTTCGVRDAILIVMVSLNAIIVYATGYMLAPRLGKMYEHVPETSADPQRWIALTLASRWALPAAMIWALVVALGFYIFDPWGRQTAPVGEVIKPLLPSLVPMGDPGPQEICLKETPRALLNGLGALFIFCGNLIIGMAVAAIVRFWIVVLGKLDLMDLRILNLSHEPLPALQRANSLIVMVCALVASLSMMGLILSGFVISDTLALHVMGTLIVVMAAYAVPILPLSNRLRALKSEALDHVETRIEAHLRDRSGLPPRVDGPLADPETPGGFRPLDSLPPLDVLLESRDLIRAVRTLPPGGQVSVSAAAIVTVLSFMPAVLDKILNG